MSVYGKLSISAGTRDRDNQVEVKADLKGADEGNSWLQIAPSFGSSQVTIGAQSRDSYLAPFPVDKKSITRRGEVVLDSDLVFENANRLLSDKNLVLDEISVARLQASLSSAAYRMIKARSSARE